MVMVDEGSARFAFGKNWRKFSRLVDQERIAAAEASLREMLGVTDLAGKRFLDIGSGSGLFSLAAHRLGAEVVSFDYDPDAVTCTEDLRGRFGAATPRWTVMRGSVLDRGFVEDRGAFDVVYSWGVLHHTGRMWEALDHARGRVAPRGTLFIAIYNDQHLRSKLWGVVKRAYVSGPVGRVAMTAASAPYFALKAAVLSATGRRPRGMTAFHDWIDWIGGYPFEVATPEAIVDRVVRDGFVLTKLRTHLGYGCNEFVFRRGS